MDKDKDILQFQNRLRDLADKSYQQGIYTFSAFLGLGEQDLFHRMERELQYASPSLWGGRENGDRCILRFGNEDVLGYEMPYPICCLHIEPLMAKFADELSHRDFLGALMNLGIERSTLGDILVGEKEAWLFCLDSMTDYICQNLTQVRHTQVSCMQVEELGLVPEEKPQPVSIQVASPRVDAVIAKVYHLSREESLNLFRAGKIYVNGRLCENNSQNLSGGEAVSVRGFGKFLLQTDSRETKKGKLALTANVFR